MDFTDDRGRRGRRSGIGYSPERSAEDFELALRWRQEWRAEMAQRAAGLQPAGHVDARPNRKSEGDQRAKFARAIARTEFGRAYFDERLHGSASRPKRHP